jgi:WD40 repeat protein
MSVSDADLSSREEPLNDILQAYRKELEAGRSPDRRDWVRRFPDVASELEALFAKQERAVAAQAASEVPTLAPGPPEADAEPATVPPAPLSTDGAIGKARIFGDYELLEKIAEGGMGIVWKARQVSLNRVVALKMILAGHHASEADVKRFQSEAEAAANLDHPNIVPIHDVGTHDGQHYFSMKYIDGGNLSPRVSQLVKDPKAAVQLLATVARAVHHAHQHGILHRDLKPGNILLDAQGQPHLTDFGLAKRVEGDQSQTRTGAIIGTPSYMAPEQARAEKGLTTAVDVYSLGALLYEMLTGKPPFKAETPLDTVLQVLEREPPQPRAVNPRLDRDLETVCLKCLEKEPARRYDSAAALADDLERWLRGEPIQARRATAWERGIKWARRKPAAAALVGVSAIAALALVGVIVGFNIRLRESLAETQTQRAIAERQSGEADDQRRLAQEQEELAKQRERRARRIGYAADMNLAQQALESGNGIRLLLSLERQNPPPGQDDLRTFEWDYLWRLSHTELQTLRHTQPPSLLAWSADGKSLAAAAVADVKVWDALTGREQFSFSLPAGVSCTALAFAPDGKTLATGGSYHGTKENKVPQPLVGIWDAATGRHIAASKADVGDVVGLAFSADGRTLIAAGTRTWDPKSNASGDFVSQMFRGRNPIMPSWIWSWDLTTGRWAEEPLALPGWLPTLQGMALATDGKTVAAKGLGIPLAQIAADWLGLLAFRVPRASLVDFGGRMESIVGLWAVPGGEPVHIRHVHGRSTLSFGSLEYDGRTAVWATLDGELVLRDARTGQERSGPPDLVGYDAHFTLSPDGGVLAFSGKGGAVKLWSIPSKREISVMFGHRQTVLSLAFSPDGRTLAAGGADNTVKLWSTGGQRKTAGVRIEKGSEPTLALTPDGKTLIVTDEDHVKLWDLAGGRERGRLLPQVPSDRLSPLHSALVGSFRRLIVSVAVSPDGRLLAGRTVAGIQIWNLTTLKPETLIPSTEDFGAVTFTPDGRFVKVGRTFWAVDSWKKQVEPPVKDLFEAKAFSQDGKRYATVETSNKEHAERVRNFNLAEGRAEVDRVFSDMSISPVAFSPDGRTVSLASSRGQGRMASNHRVMLLNLSFGGEEIELKGHTQSIRAVAFSPDGQTLATASQDGTVKLWDPVTGQERVTLRHEDRQPVSLVFSPDGETLAVSWAGKLNKVEAGLGGLRQGLSAGVVTLYKAAPRAERPSGEPQSTAP